MKKDFSNGSYGADRADSRISVSMVSSVRFVHGGAQAGQATDGFSYSVNTKDTGTKFPVVWKLSSLIVDLLIHIHFKLQFEM